MAGRVRERERRQLPARLVERAEQRGGRRHRHRRQLHHVERRAQRRVHDDADSDTAASDHVRHVDPYSGTPIALPGTVQFENYDIGGADIAYYDTTASNSGGAYRTNAVDIKATTDSGGGYHIGWTDAREWLNYTVKVGTSGTYAMDFRIASSGTGGTFHVEVNGVNKTGAITIPNTGSWSTWKTITKTGVSLSAGTQIIKIVLDTNGASGQVGNLNWFAVR